MTKETWIRHMEQITGFKRPSDEHGCMADTWKEAQQCHFRIDPDCQVCKERRKTQRAVRAEKNKRMLYGDLGLIRVKGALGGVYYE
jgi:hypothetical protein